MEKIFAYVMMGCLILAVISYICYIIVCTKAELKKMGKDEVKQ